MNIKRSFIAFTSDDLNRSHTARLYVFALLFLGLLISTSCVAQSKGEQTWGAAPKTVVRGVIENHFGTRVEDPYRWMEQRNSPEFERWLRDQDAHARSILRALPERKSLRRRLLASTGGGSVIRNIRMAGGRVFFLMREAGAKHPVLIMRITRDGRAEEKTVVDAAMFGTSATIDYYEPSPDGRRLVYGVSRGGSEASVLNILDLETGLHSRETIDRADYAEPAWLDDASGFYYNRLNAKIAGAAASERYLSSRVYLHRIGTDPVTDVPVFGRGVAGSPELEAIDTPNIKTTPGSDVVLGLVYRGADAAMGIYIGKKDAKGFPQQWRMLAEPTDGVTGVDVRGAQIFLLTRSNAPHYRVLVVDISDPVLASARVVVEESDRVIQSMAVAYDALYISDLDAGLGRVRRYDFNSKALAELKLPLSGTVRGPVTDPYRTGAMVGLQDWLTPESWHHINLDGKVVPVPLVNAWITHNTAYSAEEVMIPSWDGTPIPLSIVRKRNAHRPAPLWLMAYGAYGVSATPTYTGVYGTSRLMPLLEDGGSYAVCHARGGGELGDEWHRAGKLKNKPNSYRDTIACAEYLIKNDYTRPDMLALEGASAGGLVAGMATVTRPELFGVVFNRNGDTNPLRLEHGEDGPLMATEFGSTATEAGFKALLAVDPTQHVKLGTVFPALMFTASFNDPRVAPWQPGKLVAHLQAASGGLRPIILRTDFEGGHVALSQSQIVEEHTEMLLFFYARMANVWPDRRTRKH